MAEPAPHPEQAVALRTKWDRSRVAFALPVVGVFGLAAANFFVHLGSSSLFVDEGFSWQAAAAPIGEVVDRVREAEVAPATYYLVLHGWIGHGSDSEAFMRFPSALVGLLLVGVLLWVGTRVAGRRAGLVAAGLGAISPLVLEYAQQVRSYIFAVAACALAAGCLLELERRSPGRARRAWLAGLVVASVGALWLNYTSVLVIGCLVVFATRAPTWRVRERSVFVGSVLVGWLLTLPLMVDQLGRGHEKGVAAAARPTAGNLIEVLGTPFDGRAADTALTLATAVGAAAMTGAAIYVLRDRGAASPRAVRQLILPLAYVPVAAVILVTLFGPDALITRYTAVGAPFMLVVVGSAIAAAPRQVAVPIALAAIFSGVAGSVAAHRPDGYYPDVRSAAEHIAAEGRPTDQIALSGITAVGPTFDYYAGRTGIRRLKVLRAGASPARFAGVRPGRVWLVQDPPRPGRDLSRALERFGYRLAWDWRFRGTSTVQLVRADRSR